MVVQYPAYQRITSPRSFGTTSASLLVFCICACGCPNPDVVPPPNPVFPEPQVLPRQPPVQLPPDSPIPGLGRTRASFPARTSSIPAAVSTPQSILHTPPSISDFPIYHDTDFVRVPETTTITSHTTIPLRAFCIAINIDLGGVIICLNCGCGVTPAGVVEHIKSHFRGLDIPPNLGDILQREFGLPAHTVIPMPQPLQTPVFGLTIFPDPLFFCRRCGHGYSGEGSLRAHQSSQRCPRNANEPDQHFIAYGQSLGFTTTKFSVDISKLRRRDEAPASNPAALYTRSFAPPPDYSRWIEHLAGRTPESIQKLTEDPEDDYSRCLRGHLLSYFSVIQTQIKKHASHGLMRKMAQVGVGETRHQLLVLKDASLQDYVKEVVRLLVNTIAQALGEVPTD
ncbi:hypothetical protein B0H19DRAFT_1270847 [Mycena capillaripes]|nr:hypothetical protein B0H19DRAFT_1270847 [Mycena capillaripes]